MATPAAGGGGEGAWSEQTAAAAAGPGSGDGPPNVDAAFKLQVEEGATVSATFPFFGDPTGGQLSFQIGDHIQVLQKDELWSWGKLEKSGEEGWFPHNYVQAAFQPLPGMHELQQRIRIKKAREEAIARGEDPDAAEALILNGGQAPVAVVKEREPPQPQTTGLEGGGLGIDADGWDWGSMGMGTMAPAPGPMPMMEPPQPQGNGMGWGTQGGDSDMFGMWMEDLGEEQSDMDDNESLASVSSSDRERRRRERKNIARELLDTEDKYVRMLEALLATIIRPCLGQGSNKSAPMPKDEANELFGTLRAEEILAINTAFREQLRGRMATLSDETCFGDLFKRFAPFLKMYVEYCTQHENTSSRVSLIASKNDKFGNLLHRARSDPRCQDLDAQSLLIMPIQRIPRYKLLLEGMLKNTEKDHPDRPLLQNAIEQISDVASFINDSIKRRENQAKIWDLQAMLSEPIDLAKPTRIFIRSGVLTKLGRRYQDREDFFALFNDGLLHAKPSTFGTKYVFKRIDAVLQVENVGFLKDKPKALHAFRVVTKGHIYLLAAKSLALKKDWMRLLELCIRGGKRETIHKGPLRVLRVGKDAGVRLEFFYIFNDVVVRGKALWRGKFKHKETMVVTRVDSSFSLDARHEALLPKEVSSRMAHEQTFRIFHRHGSVIVMAKSETDKAVWLSSLEHQMKLKKTAHLQNVTASNRIVHEDNFADLERSSQESHASPTSTETGKGFGLRSGERERERGSTLSSPASSISSNRRSTTSEQARRSSAAATLGVGPVDAGSRGGTAGAAPGRKSSSSRERRRTTDGSPDKSTPLSTTSDLLISLESSDEEDGAPATQGGRQSMPYSQQPRSREQMVRRQTAEGHVSPPKATPSALVPANGNGSAGTGPSLLDRDLMAVFGAPLVSAPNSQQQQRHSQQMQRNSSTNAFGNGAMVGAAGVGGGGAGGVMPRSRSGPSGVGSSAGVPLLQPPTRDTPSYNRSAYNMATAQQQQQQLPEVAIVPHQGGEGGQGQVAPGAMVLHGGVAGGQRSSVTNGGFQFQAQGQFVQPTQNALQGQQGFGMQQQAYPSAQGGMPQMQQQQPFQQNFGPQGNTQHTPQQQQQYRQPMAGQQQQPSQSSQGYPQQQHQQQGYQQQQMQQQFQRF
eukprot:g15771.t1